MAFCTVTYIFMYYIRKSVDSLFSRTYLTEYVLFHTIYLQISGFLQQIYIIQYVLTTMYQIT